MGMLDKIKNLFYEEEVVEVPKEKIREEKKATIITKEEIVDEKKDEMDDVVSERDLLKSETTFKFPVIFEDEDFADMEKEQKPKPSRNRVNETRETASKYKKPTLDREVIREVIEKPKKFQPSPVISPIYGILDKNPNDKSNTKNKSQSLEHTKEMVINFDTIRQKAYGSLTDDIENELAPKSKNIDDIEKEIDNILEENNLLSDLEEDKTVEVENVEVEEDSNDEYNYSDFGVEYKIEDKEKDNQTKKTLEKPLKESTEETKTEENKDKQVELTEDLFNLIDSMYDR